MIINTDMVSDPFETKTYQSLTFDEYKHHERFVARSVLWVVSDTPLVDFPQLFFDSVKNEKYLMNLKIQNP